MTGEEMKAVAEKLGLAQTDVARRLGKSQQAVSDWYTGARNPGELVLHIFSCPSCRKHYLEDAALTRGG